MQLCQEGTRLAQKLLLWVAWNFLLGKIKTKDLSLWRTATLKSRQILKVVYNLCCPIQWCRYPHPPPNTAQVWWRCWPNSSKSVAAMSNRSWNSWRAHSLPAQLLYAGSSWGVNLNITWKTMANMASMSRVLFSLWILVSLDPNLSLMWETLRKTQTRYFWPFSSHWSFLQQTARHLLSIPQSLLSWFQGIDFSIRFGLHTMRVGRLPLNWARSV